jgi:hypothetical protein
MLGACSRRPVMGSKPQVPFAIVPLMLGFVLLFTGALLMCIGWRPDLDATTEGAISEISTGMTNNMTTCSTTATYTVDGRQYVAKSLDSSTSNCDLSVGDPVVVQYDSSNPARGQMQLFYLPWLGLSLALTGMVLLVLGSVFVVFRLFRGVAKPGRG